MKNKKSSFRTLSVQKVFIIDRNPSLAEALAAQLSVPGSLMCEGAPSDNHLSRITEAAPDLVILDPSDLDQDLDLFCATLLGGGGKPRLLSYSFTVSRAAIQGALAAGFHGCMSKYSTLMQLEAAIAAILGGGVYFDPRFAELLWPAQNKLPEDLLSLREKEVLVRTAKGLASKQIAMDLDISAKTVETYKARAVQKLGLSDRSKVFDYALEQGWIN